MKGFLFLLMLWDWVETGPYAQDALRDDEDVAMYEVFQQPFTSPLIEAP